MKGILMRPEVWTAKQQVLAQYGEAQTRRAIKPQPLEGISIALLELDGLSLWTYCDTNGEQLEGKCPKPRYQVGETVYIKEAWYHTVNPIPTLWYKADHPRLVSVKWKSPLFMPEWAARHFITITGVRAERLQEITYEDILAEGWDARRSQPFTDRTAGEDAQDWLKHLWNIINPKYPWESNPWVFAYTFRQEIPETCKG